MIDLVVAIILLFLFYFGIGFSWIYMWKDEFNSIKAKHYRVPFRMMMFIFWPFFVGIWVVLVTLAILVMGAVAVWEAIFE